MKFSPTPALIRCRPAALPLCFLLLSHVYNDGSAHSLAHMCGKMLFGTMCAKTVAEPPLYMYVHKLQKDVKAKQRFKIV